jgi:hypothetical protein
VLFVSVVWRCTMGGEGLAVILHMQSLQLWDGVATAMEVRHFIISCSVGYDW